MKTIKIMALAVAFVGVFCFGKSLSKTEIRTLEFPELNAAKNKLMEAKNNLNKAAKDFGGHRVKAIEYADKAIKEVDEAILKGDKEK